MKADIVLGWAHGRGAETRIHIAALVRGLGRFQLMDPSFSVGFFLSPKPFLLVSF